MNSVKLLYSFLQLAVWIWLVMKSQQ